MIAPSVSHDRDLAAQARPPVRARECDLAVISNEPVNGEYLRLVLRAPADLLERCSAGQFFHLLCPAIGGEKPYLRRPMSIYGYFPGREELHFLYKVTGSGTRSLAGLYQGIGRKVD
jgi:dihydroorotate dehydrogenase electron transfer subunit